MQKATEQTTAEPKFKKWVYVPKISDRNVTLSDNTRYHVDADTGSWHKIIRTKSSSQRDRRRLYGRMRRSTGLTRSQFDKANNLLNREDVNATKEEAVTV